MPNASNDPPANEPAFDDNLPSLVDSNVSAAGLVLVATPIGNLGDFPPRAAAALRDADLVLCEDTRTTSRLLIAHDIRTRTTPLHDYNEDSRIPGVLTQLHRGKRIALVSDAGMPLLSDPGYRLVRAVIAENLPVTVIPGPNAALTALVLSGLPPHPFLFHGFPPPRSEARRRHFETLRAAEQAGLRATLIWHEAPHRLAAMLIDLHAVFGQRQAGVARELTKKFEEVRRGLAGALAAYYSDHAARGEITVILAPTETEIELATKAESLDDRLIMALRTATARDAVALIAAETGLPRKLVYERMLLLRQN